MLVMMTNPEATWRVGCALGFRPRIAWEDQEQFLDAALLLDDKGRRVILPPTDEGIRAFLQAPPEGQGEGGQPGFWRLLPPSKRPLRGRAAPMSWNLQQPMR